MPLVVIMDLNLEKIKWIATDIDGTLKPNNAEYIESERQQFLKYVQAGAPIGIITGRPVHGALYFAKIYGIEKAPLVACNGAVVYHAGKFISRRPLNAYPLLSYLEEADKLGASTLINVQDREFCYRETPWIKQVRKDRDPFPLLPANFFDAQGQAIEPVYKLTINGQASAAMGEYLQKVKRLFSAAYEVVVYGQMGLEITAKGVNKASGLVELAEYLKIDPAAVAAIGDNENDVQMLQTAGVGVAVANAFPAAKKAADYVCTQAATAGVNEFLQLVMQEREA